MATALTPSLNSGGVNAASTGRSGHTGRLLAMNSLLQKESMFGQVQLAYIDPHLCTRIERQDR